LLVRVNTQMLTCLICIVFTVDTERLATNAKKYKGRHSHILLQMLLSYSLGRRRPVNRPLLPGLERGAGIVKPSISFSTKLKQYSLMSTGTISL
jgi:hypothetical protein